MEYPDIKIRMNGYAACTLLGKAIISTTFYRKNRRIYILEATTAGTEGYLVYFATCVSGWFELIPLTDERFSKYEDELMEGI